MTNITFPIQIMSQQGNSSTVNSENTRDDIFSNMIAALCKDGQNEIEMSFDLMPTISFQNNAIITLAFTGQKSRMSCEKVRLK
jgi:hypothetical protein